MYYTVYKITNRANDKIYGGVHKTGDLNDSYMGSGKLVASAIAKHGIENFTKEYLAIFNNADDMFKMESELVNEEFVKSSTSYNIKEGGHGGWDHIPNETRRRSAVIAGAAAAIRLRIDPEAMSRHKTNSSRTLTKLHCEGRMTKQGLGFLGKKHTVTSRDKISKSTKGRPNSSIGKMWITNGEHNQMIFKGCEIPDLWRKGRK